MVKESYKNAKIFVAGHKGMVGSACLNLLKRIGYPYIDGHIENFGDLPCQDFPSVEEFEREKIWTKAISL